MQTAKPTQSVPSAQMGYTHLPRQNGPGRKRLRPTVQRQMVGVMYTMLSAMTDRDKMALMV